MTKISPVEDVRGFLQQELLPVLSPAIEQLLHHIHESGELQRALREKAAAEQEMRRQRPRRPSIQLTPGEEEAFNAAGQQTPTQDPLPQKERGRRKSVGKPDLDEVKSRRHSVGKGKEVEEASAVAAAAAAAAAADTASNEPTEVMESRFDPLVWLSEQLRKSARGPTEHYRDEIEQLVLEQIARQEAAAAEEAALANQPEGEGGQDLVDGDKTPGKDFGDKTPMSAM